MIATHIIKFFLEGSGGTNSFSGFTTHPGLWAFDGFSGSDAPVVTPDTGAPSGAGKRKWRRRHWQAEKDGKVYSFHSAAEAQEFVVKAVKKTVKGRIPAIELYYDSIKVTNVVIDDKPIINWLMEAPDVEELDKFLRAMDEEEVSFVLQAHLESMGEISRFVSALRRRLGH